MSSQERARLFRKWVIHEVGDKRIEFVESDIHRWLYGREANAEGENADVRYRVAPSIIVRSECELFCVSAPRFAVRIVFRDGGFINLRRLEFLSKTVEAWSKRRDDIPFQSRLGHVEPGEQRVVDDMLATILQNFGRGTSRSLCIADSYLSPLTFRCAGHYVITAELGKAYGQCLDGKGLQSGTPFVKHIPVGGGLCAQAVCFMATVLLHDVAHGVHGIAEITALAHESNLLEIDLGGLDAASICKYFRDERVGLDCPLITTPLLGPFLPRNENEIEKNPDAEATAIHLFAKIIRAYAASGMPVILPVDLRAMATVYQQNDITINRDFKNRPYNHAVIVVGVNQTHPWQFLINDPATYPFVQAPAAELFKARALRKAGPADGANNTQSGAYLPPKSPQVLPVTPAAVRLHLCEDELAVKSRAPRKLGLITLSTLLDRAFQQAGLIPVSSPALRDPGEMRLLYFGEKLSRRDWAATLSAVGDHQPIEEVLRSSLATSPQRFPHWCWAQIRSLNQPGNPPELPKTLLVLWDATRDGHSPSPDETRYEHFPSLVEIHAEMAGGWQLIYRRKDSEGESTPLAAVPRGQMEEAAGTPRSPARSLRTSMLSSVFTLPMNQIARKWPSSHVGAEFYTFMQSELRMPGFIDHQKRHGMESRTAMEFMFQFNNHKDVIEDLAKRTLAAFQGHSLIIGLASFVPNLGHDPLSALAEMVQGALLFLGRFARKINELDPQHKTAKISTIEIVAGSRVEGIWPATSTKSPEGRTFVANLMSDNEVRANVVRNLELVLDKLLAENSEMPHWALELEPGPLFALRDWETLCAMCLAIESSSILSPHVGLNLDIAHWRMATRSDNGRVTRIDPEIVRNTHDVFKRIAHSHISGHHHCGHFGDIPLDELTDPREFEPWLKLLDERGLANDRGGIQFSKYVSLELEAADELLNIGNELDKLSKLIK